ncbi:putative cation-transporting ATPase 13A5 [Camelus ferus]|nr:putative cation-transporting ATPase 13A5 [Camelus ferus]
MEEKSWKDHRAVLNPGEENELEVFGYQTRNLRRALCLLTSVLTCGALLLVFYWKPQWRVWASCIPCPLQEADTVLLRTTDEFQRYTRKKVICLYLSMLKFPISKNPEEPVVADCHSVINQAVLKPELKLRCIQVQKIRYVWDNLEKRFQKVGLLEDSNSCHDIHHTFGLGLTSEEQEVSFLKREGELSGSTSPGPNLILNACHTMGQKSCLLLREDRNHLGDKQQRRVDFPSVLSSKLVEAVPEEEKKRSYIEYSVAIIILSVISIVLSVYDLRQQSVKLHNLVEDHNKVQVTVIVKGKGLQELESRLLVPGDLLILPGKVSLPCDAVLIDGNCVVNEGMLTGYNTAKGDLVRSILYPRPLNFKLYSDAFKFIVFLACLGVMGFFYALGVYVYHGVSQRDTAAMALLLLTVTVPAVLPAALTTGIVYAQKRMRKKKIFCISPQRINMCGQINLVCFDKTGTLTEDGLDLWGTVPTANNCFQEVHSFTSGRALPWGPLCAAMASCHSLILLDGTIQGDPLDLKMFEGTAWGPVEAITVLRQFPFSSSLQRMSVVAQLAGDSHFHVYMKGAPEMLARFCRPETVPKNFSQELRNYTMQGFRVIALAHKNLKMQKLSEVESLAREKVESELTFLGLLIMENRLKKETKPVLKELREARIRTVMITEIRHVHNTMLYGREMQTVLDYCLGLINGYGKRQKALNAPQQYGQGHQPYGDNLQTAITVAKNSEMIPRGSQVILVEANEPEESVPASVTWQLVENQERGPGKNILVNGTIFARMSPGQKSSLVEEFQKLKEGRAALVSSFGVFKYLTMYGIIQFIGTSLLYWQLQLFGNYQYLMQDVAITLMVCLTMSSTHAYPKLAPYRPAGQLLSPPLLLSVFLNTCFTCIVQVCAFLYVKQQPWYCEVYRYSECFLNDQSHFSTNVSLERNWTGNATLIPGSVLSFESTTLWPITTINCITVAFIFSKGKPFRKPIYTNSYKWTKFPY